MYIKDLEKKSTHSLLYGPKSTDCKELNPTFNPSELTFYCQQPVIKENLNKTGVSSDLYAFSTNSLNSLKRIYKREIIVFYC